MLKITTKGRYGLRVMVRLAHNYGNGPMLLSEIARNEEISLKYAEHLIRDLKKTKLIKSYLGATGGYELIKDPKTITIRVIIESLEGKKYPVECVGSPEVCKKHMICPTRFVWGKLEESITKTLDNIKLSELLSQ